MKILIADDHALFRDALKAITRNMHDNNEYFEAASLPVFVQLLVKHPDASLALMDLNMPGVQDVEDIVKVKQVSLHMPLIIVSMYSESDIIKRAFASGASGYIPKTHNADQTRLAISTVLAGGRYVPEEVLTSNTGIDSDIYLTRRQQGVLELLLKGHSNHEIAETLHITLSTVKMHVSNIMEKHGVKSRTQLIVQVKQDHLPQ